MTYSIEVSPLYRLPSKRRLCELLFISRRRLKGLMSDSEYREWHTKSGRLIEEPNAALKVVQARLKDLIARIEHPSWLHSGVRGKSHITNAQQHTGLRCVGTIDIESFYRSTRKEYVFRFFRYLLHQPEDVAWVITDLSTYRGHLPTGSPSSQLLSFWAYRPMFEMMKERAEGHGGTLTLYVDDIAVSALEVLPSSMLSEIAETLLPFELRARKSKTTRRNTSEWKVVTGAAISPTGELDVPNRLRERIHDQVRTMKGGRLSGRGLLRLQGLLSSARQIDGSFHESLYRYVRYLTSSRS